MIVKLFRMLLKLFPRPFYERFAIEMEGVFQEGLIEAAGQGSTLRYFLRELLHFPGNLAVTYAWSMQAGMQSQPVTSAGNGPEMSMATQPRGGWGNSILAGLPHLLISLWILGTLLINSLSKVNQNTLSIVGYVLFALIILGAMLVSIFKGWKQWSTSWATYMVLVGLALIGAGATALSKSLRVNIDLVNTIQICLLSLFLAYVIYKFTGKNRLHGLLAALIPALIPWLYFEEFVPVLYKSLSWAWAFLLAFIATLIILRTRHFQIALLAALAVPILAGFPITYLGVYVGGTLPFSEPGPSIGEVFRQYLPFLTMTSTILLAPQLAVKLRQLGPELAGASGKTAYRIILAGVFFGLVYALFRWSQLQSRSQLSSTIQWTLVLLAALLFIGGFAYLFWLSVRLKQHVKFPGQIIQLAGLFILLLCVPVLLYLPNPLALSNSLGSWITMFIAIEWVCAAAWVVKE